MCTNTCRESVAKLGIPSPDVRVGVRKPQLHQRRIRDRRPSRRALAGPPSDDTSNVDPRRTFELCDYADAGPGDQNPMRLLLFVRS
jgi:hypothetical protein